MIDDDELNIRAADRRPHGFVVILQSLINTLSTEAVLTVNDVASGGRFRGIHMSAPRGSVEKGEGEGDSPVQTEKNHDI